MTIKASGRSALILAAGFWVCLAGPSLAANAATEAKSDAAAAPLALTKTAQHGARHLKKIAHRSSGKVAPKPSNDTKADDDNKPDVAADSDQPAALPPTVADANAQLAPADSPSGNAAKAMTARANDMLRNAPDRPPAAESAANADVVAPDQLNDVDRTVAGNSPPAPAVAMASADTSAAAAPAPPATAASSESSTWDQTTLIGKIFIGFGALLTMASAARMFMA